MSGFHRIRQGESAESVADENGLFLDTLWDAPQNQPLRDLHRDPHVLLPGDQLFVPDIRLRTEHCATEQVHRFRRRGVPSRLHVRFLRNREPRANLAYTLTIDGEVVTGTSDGDGVVDQPIHPRAQQVTLHFDEDPEDDVHELAMRHLDPVTEVSGVQGRLQNLGYNIPAITGELDRATQAAVARFQADQELTVSGEVDDATRDKLREVHGC